MFEITLQKSLDELGISKNKLAVEAKIRPNTIYGLIEGKSQAFRFDTLGEILDTLNNIAIDRGVDKVYGIEDVILYRPIWVKDKERK